MASVVSLVEYSNRETSAILRALLARKDEGEVIGLALRFKSRSGTEHCVFTGPYKASTAQAINAAAHMALEILRHESNGDRIDPT